MNTNEAKFFNKKLRTLSKLLNDRNYSEAKKLLSDILKELNKNNLSPDNEKLKNELFKIFIVTLTEIEAFKEIVIQCEKSDNLDETTYTHYINALQKCGQDDVAIRESFKALEKFKNSASINFVLGNTYLNSHQQDKAINFFETAINLDNKNVKAMIGSSFACHALSYYPEAFKWAQLAADTQPDNEEAVGAYGSMLNMIGCYKEARELFHGYYDRNKTETGNYYLSLSYLTAGEFAEGWKRYESRPSSLDLIRKVRLPRVDCIKDINSKTLILKEQGIGDIIFFGNFLPILLNKIDISFSCAVDPRLINILQRSFPRINFIGHEKIKLSEYNNYLPIGSLGKFLVKSENDFVETCAYLKTDATIDKNIAVNLGKTSKIKVGISWISRNPFSGTKRSIILKRLLSAFPKDRFKIISLQYGDDAFEVDEIADQYGVEFEHAKFVDKFNDIDELLSLINNCDLIVTVDNSTAHFSGALGKPTFLLLCKDADWRWMIERNDTPWYKSLKLIRQDELGHWDSVLKKLSSELKSFMITR